MARTISDAFQALRTNLEITNLQTTTVSVRQNNVRDVVAAGMAVEDTFLTGSYARSTMIAPLSQADVDVFVVLAPSYYQHFFGQGGGPAGLLDYVKRTLLKTYTQTPDISRNGQAVTIRFSDFVVDVVPGFNRRGGGYLIPNSITNSWLETDPKKHVELWAAANKAHNGDMVPVIKMVKGWNKQNGAFFRSFHLEVLALQIFYQITISDFPSGVRFYFEKARQLIRLKNLDPAGYGDDVGKYLNSADKIGEAERRLQTAYERSVRAEEYARNSKIFDAITTWKLIFGDYFPAYG